MARILRCPACGALWRLTAEESAARRLVCGECGSTFDAEKAETLEVDDEMIDARLDAEASDGTQRPNEDEEDEKPSRATCSEASASGHGMLWGVLGVIGASAIASASLILAHDAVLSRLPELRPVYQSVCGTVPCPGFAWSDAAAWRIQGELLDQSASPGDDAASLNEILPTRVRVRLDNPTSRMLLVPMVEIKLLDAAGTPIAGRLLEPADLGLTGEDGRPPRLAPGEHTEVEISIRIELPIPPATVECKAWNPLSR